MITMDTKNVHFKPYSHNPFSNPLRNLATLYRKPKYSSTSKGPRDPAESRHVFIKLSRVHETGRRLQCSRCLARIYVPAGKLGTQSDRVDCSDPQ